MKIAVTHENGNVFGHFGKTKEFKVYDVDGGSIMSCDILAVEGEGHSALAGFLSDNDVDIVICGCLGNGAQNALEEAGIVVIAGAEGNTDDAVEAFLAGAMEDNGQTANCGCGGNESDCGSDREGGCGGGCGSCGGGCGGGMPEITLEGPNAGKLVNVHYTGTFNDGTKFDSSYDRNETLEFICGAGMMIPGFDKAVATMEVGQTIDIHLMPEEAYGKPDPRAIFTIETEKMPGSENLEVGAKVYLQAPNGQSFPALVTAKEGDTITFDTNNEMAGKELNFKIELVSVKDM